MTGLRDKIFSSGKLGEIKKGDGSRLFITGVNGSLLGFVISFLHGSVNPKIVFCSADAQRLFRLRDDLDVIAGKETASIFLGEYDEEFETEVSPVSSVLKRFSSGDDYIMLVDPSVFRKNVMSREEFSGRVIKLKKGSEYSFDSLIGKLSAFGFKRKKMAEEENDYAVRGGIVDVFPENLAQPLRIEFFGDTVESIREFDIETQRSISRLDEAEILPQPGPDGPEPRGKVADYIPPGTLFLFDEPDILHKQHETLFGELKGFRSSYLSVFGLSKAASVSGSEDLKEVSFNSRPQPPFGSNVKLLFASLKELAAAGHDIFITASDANQAGRFKGIVEELDENDELLKVQYLDSSVHEGFILPDERISVFTEHEVFGRFFRTPKRRRRFGGISFRELSRVNYGDYMVHQNYGVGKYAGLRKIRVGNVEQEAVKLLYEGNDTVFVNLSSLNLIKKFSAAEGVKPRLNRLGGTEWERVKKRAKKKIKDIAGELIMLYSKRKLQKGFRFSSDSVWLKELEASFIYEDTPDQALATEEVKRDMESESPMDRLVCGDVGFGKTEVAVRASFKCVLDNKQAAVLVPTTILAEQHYNTFKDRLSPWAAEVEHFSRFKTKALQKEILRKLKDGKINIIIGTHRLLSADVKFKDLGLLIIDEEQRFGVKAKEKLKMMKENVDVLTLTATPIPRTLNFSMLGARDLSIINTPPKNRQPIHTEIINFDKKVIANAINKELQREGQVYFVSDRISRLDEIAGMIEELVPAAKVAVAHGQMNPLKLEKVMIGFLEKKTNVLVCTKIIESGLDIPSVNTIIINRADNFGLAELYQLRGRVGRSNVRSFAYLITPPHSSLTRQAIRRLHALEEFTELGSGMNLALRDLEIRGAGNLLGGEQSGFINEIGFETYLQILDEAMNELKSSMGAVVPEFRPVSAAGGVVLESDLGMLIPEWYMDDENSRLEIYQRLSSVSNSDELSGIKGELEDRFGKLPPEVESLFRHVGLKLQLSGLPFNRVVLSSVSAELFFDTSRDEIFTSGMFEKIAGFINDEKEFKIKLRQAKKTLSVELSIPKGSDPIGTASQLVKQISSFVHQSQMPQP